MPQANQPLGIDQCTCSAMRKATRQITRLYDSHLAPSGLSITQFLMLASLKETGGATVNGLAERLDIERTATGKMAGYLERDGFLTMRPSPDDGRARIIEISDAGRALHKRAEPMWEAAQAEFARLNGAERVAALREGLRGMTVGELAEATGAD
jgi:DNA-binding MarR family transcriptional regulator